jgi:hypothetical protein
MNSFQNLKSREVELHQLSIRSDQEWVNSLLHESFVECGRSGQVYTRDMILDELSDEISDYTIWSQDYSAWELSDGVVLLTYRSARLGPDGTLYRHSFRSSIWQLTADDWKIRFHQGTPCDEFEQAVN